MAMTTYFEVYLIPFIFINFLMQLQVRILGINCRSTHDSHQAVP